MQKRDSVRTLRRRWCRLLAVWLLAAIPVAAEQVFLGPSQDNTLYEEPGGLLSCGAGQTFIAGTTTGELLRRAVLQFDFASIPPDSLVTAATLRLVLDRTVDSQTAVVSLHRVQAAWGEGTSDCDDFPGIGAGSTPGDATWIHTFFDTSFWAVPGGDFEAVASASISVDGIGTYEWSSPEMVADVQRWVDGSANHGWILVGEESGRLRTTRRFASREHVDGALRPALIVDFDPPDGLEACCSEEGFCTLEDPLLCDGVPPGVDSCDPNICPQPLGACCFPDSTCEVLGQADCLIAGGFFAGADTTCEEGICGPEALEPFVDALPRLRVAEPFSRSSAGGSYYRIAMTEFQQKLHRDLPPTTVWGYDGSFPGPTIETSPGARVRVDWLNDLRDSEGTLRSEHYLPVDTCAHGPSYWRDTARTVVHLHGGHVPGRFDGHPELDYRPGTYDTYVYPNYQLPASLWYHDHALGITRLNVHMGLAGLYIIRPRNRDRFDLPRDEFEIALLIQDRSFNADGSLSYPANLQNTFFGDTILVNGKVWPYLAVKRGKYRLRILNGSNSRTYTLTLSDGSTFAVIGTDGGLIGRPLPVTEITIAPAERYEVVIDFEPYAAGTEVVLTNSAPIEYPNLADPSAGVVPNVMKFIVTNETGDTDDLPTVLRPVEPILPRSADRTRRFNLRRVAEPCAGGQWLIESLDGQGDVVGSHWDDITEVPALGSTEIWEFINATDLMHPMHMHLVMFQLLDRVDLETGLPVQPEPYEVDAWKDTVRAMPNTVTRVIARFEDYVGKFAYHCHILEHEDHEMMRQFQVANTDCNFDGICGPGEDCISCGSDCQRVSGASCGNGLCEAGDGENCRTCAVDCAGSDPILGSEPFCCGLDEDCSDPRCTRGDFFCRQMPRVEACCGDLICEGLESRQSCGIDCNDNPLAIWTRPRTD